MKTTAQKIRTKKVAKSTSKKPVKFHSEGRLKAKAPRDKRQSESPSDDMNTPPDSKRSLRHNKYRMWVVVDGGGRVVYRGRSCGAAVHVLNSRKLPVNSLYVSSEVAKLLRDTLPKTDDESQVAKRANKSAVAAGEQAREYSTDEIREAGINNVMYEIWDFTERYGICVDMEGSDEPKVTADICHVDFKESFVVRGNTNRDIIAGVMAYLRNVADRILTMESELAGITPSPLPTGLWVTRDAKGKFVRSSLCRYGTTPEGCTQSLEPFEE